MIRILETPLAARSDVIGSRSPPSCPSPDLIRGLSRASTPFLRRFSKQHVGGRDKPGHDSGEMLRHDSNLGSAIIDVAPPPAHDLWRGAKPMRLGMTPPGPANSLFRRKLPCSDNKNSLFSEEQGKRCKPLNPLGDRLPKPSQEAGIGRNFQKFPVNFPALRESLPVFGPKTGRDEAAAVRCHCPSRGARQIRVGANE